MLQSNGTLIDREWVDFSKIIMLPLVLAWMVQRKRIIKIDQVLRGRVVIKKP